MEVAGYGKTFAIDQGTVLGMDQLFSALYNQPLTDPKREGICTGLSMIWLARLMMNHGETPEQRKSALHSAGGYRWGGKSQDIHLKSSAGASGTTWEDYFKIFYGDALKAYVLRIVNNSTVDAHGGDTAKLAKAVAPGIKGTHSYRLWNIGLTTPTGAAGHMVASYASGGKLGFMRHLYFFDPNMGEFKLDIGDAEKFTKAWVDAYAAAFTGVTSLATFAVQRG